MAEYKDCVRNIQEEMYSGNKEITTVPTTAILQLSQCSDIYLHSLIIK